MYGHFGFLSQIFPPSRPAYGFKPYVCTILMSLWARRAFCQHCSFLLSEYKITTMKIGRKVLQKPTKKSSHQTQVQVNKNIIKHKKTKKNPQRSYKGKLLFALFCHHTWKGLILPPIFFYMFVCLFMFCFWAQWTMSFCMSCLSYVSLGSVHKYFGGGAGQNGGGPKKLWVTRRGEGPKSFL